MQAIILAGGFGTRLSSVVGGVPKPLAPVAGRPFLCWLLEYMSGQGVREAVLCVHHEAEQIRRLLGSRYAGIRLRYSMEEKPLGTGGAIQQAMYLLAPQNPIMILNGDSLVEVNYRAMLAEHKAGGSSLTLAATHMNDCSRYSRLTTQRGKVVRYETRGDEKGGLISVGCYAASPNLFAGFNMPERFSFEQDFLAVHTPALKPACHEGVRYFIDIGVPSDYTRAQNEIPAHMDVSIAA